MTQASTRFVRASNLVGRPVVTMDGDHDHEVQDLVLDRTDQRSVEALALREPGLLGGRHKSVVAMAQVRAIGTDAVMVEAGAAPGTPDDRIGVRETVKGIRVVTDGGVELGTVVDAVIETHEQRVRLAAVELRLNPESGGGPDGDGLRFLALPHDLVLSDQALVVPADVIDRLCKDPDDLAEAVVRAHGGW